MENMIIPLLQHIGKPAKPIVREGEEVKRGQLIAVPDGLGANIHSSVSGIVKEISDGFIKIDALEKQPEDFVKIKDTTNYLEAIKEAGIVGAGGAGFPTHIKLNTKLEDGFVVANATECEPLLGHNMARIVEDPDLIVRGLKYVMEITGAKKRIYSYKAKEQTGFNPIGKSY